MSGIPSPPFLRSRNHKASWVNRAGRVDRSACFEVRASELWPLIPSVQWSDAATFKGRQALAMITVTARMLRNLHDTRPPQQLVGDWRTRKSNAMKDERGEALKTRPPLRLLLEELEKRYLEEVLAETSGTVSAAARATGIDRVQFYRMLSRHGLR